MTETMRAQWYERYGRPGGVLESRMIERPSPGPGQVLVKVHATSVQPLDWHLMTGEPRVMRVGMGLRRPSRNIPGADVAGTVESIGEGVTRFRVGDEVLGEVGGGGCAEYLAAPERRLVAKPDSVSFEEAAAVPVAGLTALQGLRDWGRQEAGQEVLIIGASGGVGTYAVQVAKALGARVTGVCSPRNVETARDLGADDVIDYTVSDYAATGRRYDLIFDVAGKKALSALQRLLVPGGTYVGIGGPKGPWVGPLPRVARMKVRSLFASRRMTFGIAAAKQEDLETLADLLGRGVIRSVIDRNYKLDETAAAVEYIGEGHAKGKVVVTI
jgi:NADPH:quinone reductase-like Zn-dependent oxidoreductase